jgi:hypothetical protein
LRHRLEPGRKARDGERDSAEEQQGEIEQLSEQHAFLHGVDQRRDNAAQRSEREQAQADEDEQGNRLRGPRSSQEPVGQRNHEGDVRQLQGQRGYNAGNDNLSGPNRRDLETAEDILLAILHGSHPHAEQACAKHTQAQHDV